MEIRTYVNNKGNFCSLNDSYIIEVVSSKIKGSHCEVILKKKHKKKKDSDGIILVRRGNYTGSKFKTSIENKDFEINLKSGRIKKLRSREDMDIHLLLPDLIGNYCKTVDGWGIVPVRIDADISDEQKCIVELNLVSDEGDIKSVTLRGKHINNNFTFEVHKTKIKINIKTGAMHKIRDASDYDI